MIEDYLKQMISIVPEKQKPFFEFMLREGKYYSEPILKENYFDPTFDIHQKSCFRNSLLGAYSHNLEYVEGYYITTTIAIPFEHAFNITPEDGRVLDFTATEFDIEVVERFGVSVPTSYLEQYFKTDQSLTLLKYYYTQKKKKR